MEINFSQFGQEIARQERINSNPVAPGEEQSSKLPDVSQPLRQTVQERTELADNLNRQSENPVDIQTAVEEITEFVQARNRQLAFSIDEESQRSVVKVTDAESGEVIRQIPSEEVLALSERIRELQTDVGAAVGVLFNKQA